MTNTAGRLLLDMVEALNEAFKKQYGEAALRIAGAGEDFATAILRIVSLGEETRSELSKVSFATEERRGDMIDRVEVSQRALLNALTARGSGHTNGPLLNDAQIERLRGVVEQIEEKGISNSPIPSRDDMMRETEALIAEVKKWEMDDYAKTTLLIQLNSIERIIQKADIYSAAELRAKVKSVIADFAAEFSSHDKDYQTRMERLVSWARKGFFPGSVMLALTADTSAVIALIAGP